MKQIIQLKMRKDVLFRLKKYRRLRQNILEIAVRSKEIALKLLSIDKQTANLPKIGGFFVW